LRTQISRGRPFLLAHLPFLFFCRFSRARYVTFPGAPAGNIRDDLPTKSRTRPEFLHLCSQDSFPCSAHPFWSPAFCEFIQSALLIDASRCYPLSSHAAGPHLVEMGKTKRKVRGVLFLVLFQAVLERLKSFLLFPSPLCPIDHVRCLCVTVVVISCLRHLFLFVA